MPDKSKDQPAEDDRPLIDLSEVAQTDHPHAPSLEEESAQRERERKAENDAAADDEKPQPFIAPPPD